MRDDDELLRLYLLDELETEEENRLEARLSQDSELFEQAEAMQSDLLDEYEHGGLSPAQRERIESYLAASPSARSELALIRGLSKVPQRAPVVIGPWRKALSSPWFQTLAAAMLAIVVLSGGIDRWTSRLQNDIEVMASQSLQLQDLHDQRPDDKTSTPEDRIVHKAPTPVPVPSPAPPPVVVQLFQLALSAHRGPGDVEVLRIQPETDRVELQLALPPGDEAYPAYQIVIKNIATLEKLIQRDDLRPQKRENEMVLLLSMEAKEVPAGSYEAAVRGLPSKGEPVDLGFPQFQVAEPEMNPQG